MKLYGWVLLHAVFLMNIAASESFAQYSITTQTPVDIVFDDIGDFQNGVLGINKSITISTLLGLSNRTLSLATASNLINGPAQIPANAVRVTSVGSGWTDRTVFLNTTSPQAVTTGITLFIFGSRTYTLSYEVPSNTLLFNKPDGIYSTTLTYTFASLLGTPATVRVNLRIQNILGISSNYNPVFTVDNADEYLNGISITRSGALTVTSTRDYDIQVRASGPFSSGSQTIASNHLRIAILNAGGTISGSVPVTTTGAQVVNEGTAVLSKPLDVRYELAGGAHLLNLLNNAYSTTLTFTISAD